MWCIKARCISHIGRSESSDDPAPNQAHRNRSRFLACRQGKRNIAAYVQELRTLIVAMVIEPMPEAVTVTSNDGDPNFSPVESAGDVPVERWRRRRGRKKERKQRRHPR
ncbi:unnamed protein product [Peronospora belbahrii]|uniref:Retrotransposon gag domain-containing protein n=1 Tax=Peronospora belbahrii TaxID=622444 RepID=A0ABN8D5Y4_9STRA|nr:unnamed protein product [Peronospora belbahrii]